MNDEDREKLIREAIGLRERYFDMDCVQKADADKRIVEIRRLLARVVLPVPYPPTSKIIVKENSHGVAESQRHEIPACEKPGRGRPEAGEEKKTERLVFNVSKKDAATVRRVSAALGLEPNEWMRRVVMSAALEVLETL